MNVVLCDLKMPVMGALEVPGGGRGRYPGIPVIIMTGLGTVADAVECMKKGPTTSSPKPFGIDHLILVVRRGLEKQKLQDQTQRLQRPRPGTYTAWRWSRAGCIPWSTAWPTACW